MKNRKSVLAAMMSVLVVSPTLMADASKPGDWYFSPNLSYVIADDDRNADDDLGLQVGVGRVMSQNINLEINGITDSLDVSGGGSIRQHGVGLDGLYFFDRTGRFAPYALVGVGYMNSRLSGSTTDNVMASVGAGVMTRFVQDAAMRLEARYRYDANDQIVATEDAFGDWLINVGVLMPFGGKAAPVAAAVAAPVVKAAPAPAPVVKDSDNDGVLDDQDRCLNTPANAKVDGQGCEVDSDMDGVVDSQDRCPNSAANAKVDARGCEVIGDADQDGVPDNADRCPNTPMGNKVDAQGCDLDSDKDGVIDSKDSCPGTAEGVRVDAKGCVLEDKFVLKGVNFETSSAELTADSRRVLDDVVDTLNRHLEIKAEIAGYTDNRGSARLNQSLSQRRAESVRNYLVGKGIAADRLTAKGYGEADPVADNNTTAGQAENRRVELHILK